jgi:hypothetical protein
MTPGFRSDEDARAAIERIRKNSRAFDDTPAEEIVAAAWKAYKTTAEDRAERSIPVARLRLRNALLASKFAASREPQEAVGVLIGMGVFACIGLVLLLVLRTDGLRGLESGTIAGFAIVSCIVYAGARFGEKRFGQSWTDAALVAAALAFFFAFDMYRSQLRSRELLMTALVEAKSSDLFKRAFNTPTEISGQFFTSSDSGAIQRLQALTPATITVSASPEYVRVNNSEISRQLEMLPLLRWPSAPRRLEVTAEAKPDSLKLRFMDKQEAFFEMRPAVVLQGDRGLEVQTLELTNSGSQGSAWAVAQTTPIAKVEGLTRKPTPGCVTVSYGGAASTSAKMTFVHDLGSDLSLKGCGLAYSAKVVAMLNETVKR